MLDPKPEENRSAEASYVLIDDVHDVERRAKHRRRFWTEDELVDPWSYAAKRGEGTLRLPIVEFRIFQFLASRPNQALSHHRIAAAVSTRRHIVTVETLSRFINSLRGHLGFYSDYIQSVPYIGYRFKG
jgi:DNA-binding response OmpR family regulator